MTHQDDNNSSRDVSSDDTSSSENEDWDIELSEEQRKLFEEKLAAAQNQFKVFNTNQKNQKISDVMSHIKDIDEKCAEIAIKSCYGNELLAIKRLMEEQGFKETIEDMASGAIELDMDSIYYRDKRQEMREALQWDPEVDSEQDEGDYYEIRMAKRSKDEMSKEGDDDEFVQPKERERKVPRLLLDDALIMLANQVTQDPSDSSPTDSKEESDICIPESKPGKKSVLAEEKALFAALSGSQARKISDKQLVKLGWSDARIKAFKNREKNPNQYYYRFNDPGEPQATGKWSDKDKALFLKLIKEKGVDYQWGIFSMQIPGRVGYQCSNFYRQLIKEGEIKDENYVKNKDGKYVFMFRNKNGESTLHRSKSTSPKTKRQTKRVITIEPIEEKPDENVLPDYIDPMTMMPVECPAISPYGHVMGYKTWVKVLNKNPKNTCPFTKKKLTRRSLVKLNSENIDEYRDKIINVTGIEADLHSSS